MNSILTSIKKLLGLSEEVTVFDNDIIIHINTVLSSLIQMGVGPQDGFSITSAAQTWDAFIGDKKTIEQVKSLVYLKVRLLFDPPTTSFLLESINRQISELEYRVYTEVGGY